MAKSQASCIDLADPLARGAQRNTQTIWGAIKEGCQLRNSEQRPVLLCESFFRSRRHGFPIPFCAATSFPKCTCTSRGRFYNTLLNCTFQYKRLVLSWFAQVISILPHPEIYSSSECIPLDFVSQMLPIQAWGPLAKFAATLKAGTPVITEGKIRPETYTADGVEHKTFSIKADYICKIDYSAPN